MQLKNPCDSVVPRAAPVTVTMSSRNRLAGPLLHMWTEIVLIVHHVIQVHEAKRMAIRVKTVS
jgi:hypothetical protein